MKRSEINTLLRQADEFFDRHHFRLPPFAYWTPEEWASKAAQAREIVERRLGWDVTDFGSGDFTRTGLLLFTLRNGAPENLQAGRGKVYAEKIMMVGVDQVTPLHTHGVKTEDIINRGGGRLMIELRGSTAPGILSDGEVTVSIDGVERRVPAGGTATLEPGESITLVPGCYHRFWAADAPVLAGEVSTVNDDAADNYFYQPAGRFPTIEPDEPPLYLLVGDYENYIPYAAARRAGDSSGAAHR